MQLKKEKSRSILSKQQIEDLATSMPVNYWRATTVVNALNKVWITDEVSDIICDLHHYCDAKGFDFTRILEDGVIRYQMEIQDDGKNIKPKTFEIEDVCENQEYHREIPF